MGLWKEERKIDKHLNTNSNKENTKNNSWMWLNKKIFINYLIITIKVMLWSKIEHTQLNINIDEEQLKKVQYVIYLYT